MRIGVLTGGGDCPGLNAVIRAIVRKGVGDVRPRVRRLPRRLARARWRATAGRSGCPRCAGSCPAAARSSAPRGPTRSRTTDGPERIAREPRGGRGRRPDRDRRRGHARRRLAPARRARVQRRRRAEDDRQRPRRDRLHLRLRHRGQHRDGGDRPPPHHRRQPPPGADRRGDGPPRRLDRLPRRPRRRRQRDPHPRAASSTSSGSASWSGSRFESHFAPIIVVAEGAEPVGGMPERDEADRRLRPRPARRDRALARGRDRAPHRQRDAGDGARPRPARRHPDRLRPGPRDPLRAARDRRRPRRALGHDDGAARAPRSSWST